MIIQLEIPKEFAKDYASNRFDDFFRTQTGMTTIVAVTRNGMTMFVVAVRTGGSQAVQQHHRRRQGFK